MVVDSQPLGDAECLPRICSTRMLSALFRELRPYQWLKNVVVFAALVFAQQLDIPGQLLRSLGAFVVLCAASSAMYLLNDMVDIEKDRAHPEKRNRPLASGSLAGT